MTETDILDFINNNFKENRAKLFQLINGFHQNPITIKTLGNEFANSIKNPFTTNSYSSRNIRNSKTKRKEIGDISEVWTFCLNENIVPTLNVKDFDWDFVDYLKSGQELHLCRIWTNWFLPIFYLETTYEFIDTKKKVNQFGQINLTNKHELGTVNSILEILNKNGYQRLENEFVNRRIKGVSTDFSEKNNATIFECLFSDLCYPTKHIRRNIKSRKKSVNEKPQLSFTEYLDENRDVVSREAEIYQNAYSPLTITFDKYNKIIETESRGKLNGKTNKIIRIKYE